MQNETEELKKLVARLNQRVRNLELLALGILIGLAVYVTRAAGSWFEINSSQAIVFGCAFTVCLMLMFWRQHIAAYMKILGVKQSIANVLVGSVAVLGVAYMVPALISFAF